MFNRAIDPALLEMIVCLADEGSFTAAAERLHLTQQAVSAQMKRLEALTGQSMVMRTPQHVQLTQAGEALLVYARQSIHMAEQIRRQFSTTPLEGSVRFGFPPGFGAPMLFPLLAQIRRLHPRLELYCETEPTVKLVSKLDAGMLDVIVGAQRDGQSQGAILLREKLIWVGDTEQLVRPAAPIPLVMLPSPAFLRDHVFEVLSKAGLTWTVFFESEDAAIVSAAVQSGWGMSLFNQSRLSGEEGLLASKAQDRLPDAGFIEFFLRHNGKGKAVVHSFAEVLRTVVGDRHWREDA